MKNSIKAWSLTFVAIVILGFITPFIDSFVVFQVFFLLIPFGIILIVSIFIALFNLIKHRIKLFERNTTKAMCIIPLFILSQFISINVVDKIQLYRSNEIIERIENNEIELNINPQSNIGIEYSLLRDNTYLIEYELGFMTTKRYYSENKAWESYGWND